MKDILKLIKNGNVEEFIGLVSESINEIYTYVSNQYDEHESTKITKQIILNLYNDIVNKYFWQNAESFLKKSLHKSYKRYNIKEVELEKMKVAPPQVLRGIMVDLSKNIKRKGFVSNTVKIIAGIIIVSLLCTGAYFYTVHASKPKEGETIYRGVTKPKILVQDTYYVNKAPFFTTNCNSYLIKLGDTGVCLDIMKSIDAVVTKQLKIYSKGILIKEIIVKDHSWQVIGGNLKDKYLVFISKDKLIKTDLNLNVTNEIARKGTPALYSPNGKYCIFTKAEFKEIINLDSFKRKEIKDSTYLKVNNNGETVSYNLQEIFELLGSREVMKVQVLSDNSKVVLMKNGIVANIKDKKVIWQNELQMIRENENESIYHGDILETSNKVHIVIHQNKDVYFQSYTQQGLPIHDMSKSKIDYKSRYVTYKDPISLANGDIMLINSNDGRYKEEFVLIFTDKVPMKEVMIEESAKNYLFEKGDNVVYLYADSESDISIYEINIAE